MIELTFFLQDNQTDSSRCDILVESHSDYTSSGHEAEIAEQIAVAALKAIRLDQSVYVVRKGNRMTVSGRLSLYNATTVERHGNHES